VVFGGSGVVNSGCEGERECSMYVLWWIQPVRGGTTSSPRELDIKKENCHVIDAI
jgi:hypothetical protein